MCLFQQIRGNEPKYNQLKTNTVSDDSEKETSFLYNFCEEDVNRVHCKRWKTESSNWRLSSRLLSGSKAYGGGVHVDRAIKCQVVLHLIMVTLRENNLDTAARNCDGSIVLSDVIVAHLTSIQMLKTWSYVLVLDTAYKTNNLRNYISMFPNKQWSLSIRKQIYSKIESQISAIKTTLEYSRLKEKDNAKSNLVLTEICENENDITDVLEEFRQRSPSRVVSYSVNGDVEKWAIVGNRMWREMRNNHVYINFFDLNTMSAFSFWTCSLVPRGTMVPYSATVNLVEVLGLSQVVSEHLGIRWHTILVGRYTRRARSWAGPVGLHHCRRTPLERLSQRGARFQLLTFHTFLALVEEDPSEPQSDLEIVVEPEEWQWLTMRVWAPYIARSSLLAVSSIHVLPAESTSSFPSFLFLGKIREQDICGYLYLQTWKFISTGTSCCLKPLDFEECQKVGGLELQKLVQFSADHRLGMIFKKSSKRSRYLIGFASDERTVELQRALAPLSLMGFAAVVEAATQMEMADQTVIQRKVATGLAAPPYKRPRQGPWKLGDSKRPRNEQRTGNRGR
ncbi:hypothetical protein M9H77_18364 [Catharanthus roseus]|uniref:Uncharacterized protein n=1 Tax=Catharanthus roseus TaxID=4058 RepID=A0ACC0B788_CATRO|nr:hypothetical protein M9H77_18364 [Catharanthus roseus]